MTEVVPQRCSLNKVLIQVQRTCNGPANLGYLDNVSQTSCEVIALWCDGARGLYIHPGIWHEGIFPLADRQRFLDRQGRVHARVSCDIAAEFGLYLSVPLAR